MAINHLTDTEIQDYLDGNLAGEKESSVMWHLDECQACQHEMNRYKRLYTELKSDADIELSPNFSTAVMSKLHRESSAVFQVRFRDILLSILGLIVSLGTMVYYVDFKSIMKSFDGIFQPNRYFKPEFISGARDLFSGFKMDSNLIIFAGLILLIFVVVDHIITRHKDKLLSFLKMVPVL